MIIPIFLGLLLLGGGGVFAAYRYDAANLDRILPGVTVAGIDVGGMTRKEAVQAVKGAVEVDLDREVTVRAAGQGSGGRSPPCWPSRARAPSSSHRGAQMC